jgi:hypothetical protein
LNKTSVKIELSLIEINGILQALGNMPYVQVVALIDKIKQQVTPQIQSEPDDNHEP